MKIHLFHSAEPIEQGRTLDAACGRKVANAVPVYMVDYAMCDIAYSLTGICHKCRKVDDRKRYVYGIAQGEEIEMEKSLHV